MAEPELVVDCLKAMGCGVDPVTVSTDRHRRSGHDYLARLRGHRRNPIGLPGVRGTCAQRHSQMDLSPKENREIPPLKYPYVHRLKQEFAELEIVINGGSGALVGYRGPTWLVVDA